MKITVVNTHDVIGGAERASYDLAAELFKNGDEARLYVGGQHGFDRFTRRMHYRRPDYMLRRIASEYLGLTDTTLWSPVRACLRFRDFAEADLVNVHNMHGSYWNFWTLGVLARRAPVVVTLHDEWFLTGDCAYTYDCDRWQRNCGRCPQLSGEIESNRYALGGRDLTRLNVNLKRWATSFVHSQRLAVVSPSRWLLGQAAKAKHLQRFPMHHIEYGLDLSVYRPQSQDACRKSLSLPLSRKLAFCVASNLDDPRKNFAPLFELVGSGGLPEDMTLVCAGNAPEREQWEGNSQVTWLGFLETREQMATAIGACDLSIVLSKADNLPYVCLESFACGRPVLGTTAGGIPEIVVDGQTGWLLPHNAGKDAIGRTLREIAALDDDRLAQMGQRAREQAQERYGMAGYVSSYREVFRDMIDRCASPS